MKPHSTQSPEKQRQLEEDLYEAIAVIRTPAQAQQFFEDLCTPAEIQAMADRWHVVHLIKMGMSYRQIYEATGVSVTTVGRVARCILLGEGGYNIIYSRLEKKNNDKKIQAKNRGTKKWKTK